MDYTLSRNGLLSQPFGYPVQTLQYAVEAPLCMVVAKHRLLSVFADRILEVTDTIRPDSYPVTAPIAISFKYLNTGFVAERYVVAEETVFMQVVDRLHSVRGLDRPSGGADAWQHQH